MSKSALASPDRIMKLDLQRLTFGALFTGLLFLTTASSGQDSTATAPPIAAEESATAAPTEPAPIDETEPVSEPISALNAAILGVVQGLTEFLPVSSSGHIELVKKIQASFNKTPTAPPGMLMTVVLHMATALSTLVVFRKDVGEIIAGIFQFKWNEHAQFAAKIIVSMIPAAIIGIKFNDEIDNLFMGNLLLVGSMLCLTGVLLFLADRAKDTDKPVGFVHAIIIGIAQAIAIVPGISRSGATISTSVLLGIDRMRAARFSFLMVVPLIFGKMAKDLIDGDVSAASAQWSSLGIGFVAAFVTGIIACQWMIALVRKSKLTWFAIYCLIVGTIAIVYHIMNA